MTEILKALGHENRLGILALLMDNPLCVCDFEENLNLTQSNVSRHLAVLRNAGIIKSYKTQQWVYYVIAKEFMENHKMLWLYLQKAFKEQPYMKLRKKFSAASNCAGPIPVELTAYRLERENYE